jgi:DNA-binding CsgD family transcriptional regulator
MGPMARVLHFCSRAWAGRRGWRSAVKTMGNGIEHGRSGERRPGTGTTAGAAARVVSPDLVGRDDEFASMLSAVAAAPAVVVVEGEAGVGKTRLIAEFLASAELVGHARLVGRCHPIRESFPLGPVVDAVRRVGQSLRELPLTGVAGSLRALLPELADQLPEAPPPVDDRSAERHRVFRGLVEILGLLGPTVLVLEDMHWADQQTIDFVAYLLTEVPAGLTLVLSYRDDEVGTDVRMLTARGPAAVAHRHIPLGPLPPRETGLLAASILDTNQVSEEFARYLWERTSGLPLAVEEVLALVRARGLVVNRGGTWARRVLEELEVPRGIRHATLQRLARLTTGAQRLAEAAAVLQESAPETVLIGMVDDADANGAVEELLGSRLLIEHDGLVGFRHFLAGQAVYESLTGPRRRELHRRAAEELRALSPTPYGRIAYHLRHAGDLSAWAEAAEAAADQACTLANEDEAARLLLDVLASTSLDAGQRGRLAIKLGWAALETLHARAVIQPLWDALRQPLTSAQRGELRFLLALVLGQAGEDTSRQRRLFIASVPHLTARPDLRAWATVAVGLVTPPSVPVAHDIRWTHDAVRMLTQVNDRLLEVFVLGKAASTLLDVGDPSWRSVVDRLRRTIPGAPRQRREANAHYSIGLAACYAGHLRMADEFLSAGAGAEAVNENRRLEVLLRSGLTLARLCTGRWTGLREEVTTLLDEVDDYGVVRIDMLLVSGVLALARGDLTDATGRLGEAAGLARQIYAYEILPMAAGSAARVALARGDLNASLAFIDNVVDSLDTKGVWPPACWAIPSAVETWLAAGDIDRAQRFTSRAERAMRDLDAPLAAAALGYAHGVLDRSAADVVDAAERYEALPAPYEAAKAHERAATILLGTGDVATAERCLRRALATYDMLGATWDHARAARLATGHGMKPTRRHGGGRRSYGNKLSPRERAVAELVASGQTNKEIAAELFISPHTVDKHVSAAMRKLGARARSAIGNRLTETDDHAVDGESSP